MRKDLRPWWVKRCYLRFRHWYTEYYLRPACDFLGPYHTVMKPWYVNISGNNIYIGKCFTAIGEQMHQVEIGVWGRAVVTRDVPANVVVAGNPARVVKELDPEREFVTRMDYFADPEALERFFDAINAEVLADNSVWRWLWSVIYPPSRIG